METIIESLQLSISLIRKGRSNKNIKLIEEVINAINIIGIKVIVLNKSKILDLVPNSHRNKIELIINSLV